MGNRYIERSDKKNTQGKAYWRSKKQEKSVARKIGGRCIVGSGSGPKKGDVYKPGIVRIECKTTQKKSFSITLDMLSKIEEATGSTDEIPAIVVEFLDEKGKPITDVAVIPTEYLYLLLGNGK